MKPSLACLIPACLALMVLAGCDKAKQAPTRNSAAGEILEGSVSDAMLPLDTVRSQAPLAPRSESSGGAGGETTRDKGKAKAAGADKAADDAAPPAAEAGAETGGDAAAEPVRPAAE
jgi:hypothetical protein